MRVRGLLVDGPERPTKGVGRSRTEAPSTAVGDKTRAALEARLREIFDRVDTSGDGEISVVEAVKALRKDDEFADVLGFDEATRVRQEDGTKDQLILALGALDSDGDKKISWAEFRRVALDGPETVATPQKQLANFAVGTRVEARYEAGDEWYAGVIERVDGDAYDVAYDDGDHESNVAAALVREEVVTTRSFDVDPTPEPTSPEPSAPEPTPKRPERTIDVAPPRRPPAEPRESADLLNVADAVAPEEDASDGGTAVAPNATATQTTDGYGDDDFEDFTETIKPGARTLGAASKLQDAVLGWLEYKRCDAPPEKTEWTLNEVRASVCVDGEVSSASFEKLGWKVCHQALTRLKAPNRGPTKDLADRLATLLNTS